MRRGCLLGVGALLLCLGVGALGWFVGLPAVRDGVREGIEEGVATEVALRLPATPGAGVAPGAYRVTQEQLQERLRANTRNAAGTPEAAAGDNDVVVRLSPAGVEAGISLHGQNAVDDGRLAVDDMKNDNAGPALFLPPDDLARDIADSVNAHLAANALRLQSVDPTDGAVTLVTVAAS